MRPDVDVDVDVVVVGAGPAGSATAAGLASRGHSVRVLERWPFPRDKACGDGLTQASMVQLRALGLAPALDGFRAVRGTNLTFDSGSEARRTHARNTGRVVPRAELDLLLSERAATLGAVVEHDCRVTELLRDGGRVAGVRYRAGDAMREVSGRFVVAADGATSLVARAGGLSRRTDRVGFAVRAYVDGVPGARDEFQVFVPLRDPTTGRTLAGYGWVFPLPGNAANIGVGILRTRNADNEVNLRTVFGEFCAGLLDRRPEWRDMVQRGPLRGAPLPCDFDPERCTAGGVVLVGDAARLVDPLSGEGIDTALESGAVAAEAIDRAIRAGASELTGYGAELHRRFGRRMNAAWALVDNHEFVWGVASDTVTVDRPLYRGVRAAIRTYDRPARRATPSRTAVDGWLAEHGLLHRIHDVEQALGAVAADELPMLGAAVGELRDEGAERARTALLLLCAGGLREGARVKGGADGGADGRDAHKLAVAAELACLALAAHEDVLDPAPAGGAPTRSANRFAVSAGDYLLFRSFDLATQVGAGYVQLMSRASADVCAGTLLRLQGDCAQEGGAHEDEIARLTMGTLFELPVLLGATLAAHVPDGRVPAGRVAHGNLNEWAAVTLARTAAVGCALGLVTAAGRTRHSAAAAGEERWERGVLALTAACARLPDGPFADALRTLADAYRRDIEGQPAYMQRKDGNCFSQTR